MAFPTFQFAYFFVLTATVSWSLSGRRTLQKAFLLLASYYFYSRWNLKLVALLAGLSAVDWAFGEALHRVSGARLRRWLVGFGLAANVAALGIFKLYDFFRESMGAFADFLGLSAHFPVLEVFLPAGISFYAFQGMAYLIDAYRGKAVKPRTVLDFFLFMAFFPQLMAGPICRSHELLPQIMGDAPATIREPSRAVVLIVCGLFKKVVLASLLATRLVDDAFQMPSEYSSLELLLAVFAYTAEVYLDFSGYTDLARGLALLLGFELPENFRHPYAATNIGEFWKRWHITFSTWLRDYVYFPLGGSRRSHLRTYANLVVTFAVCGLWHGSRWTFVLWGLAHGIGLAVYKMFLDLRRARGFDRQRATWWGSAGGWLLTLSFCAFARILFKSSDLDVAGEFVAGLLRGTWQGRGIDPLVVAATVTGIAMNFVGQPIFERCVLWHARIPATLRPIAWAGVGAVLLTLKTRDVAPYIYFGF